MSRGDGPNLRRRVVDRLDHSEQGCRIAELVDLPLLDRLDDPLDLRVLQTLRPVVPLLVPGNDLTVDPRLVFTGHLADQVPQVLGLVDLALVVVLGEPVTEVTDPEGDFLALTPCLLLGRRLLGLHGLDDVLILVIVLVQEQIVVVHFLDVRLDVLILIDFLDDLGLGGSTCHRVFPSSAWWYYVSYTITGNDACQGTP